MADQKQTIIGHLSELRRRLILILAVNLAAAFFCFGQVGPLMEYILQLAEGIELVYLSPSELFVVYVKLALTAGVVLCLPFTLYQLWAYVARGLYDNEKLVVAISLGVGGLFFASGVVFAYLVVLPVTLGFFQQINVSPVTAMISIEEFVSFAGSLVVAFGIVFEMPVVVGLLAQLGVVKTKTLLKHQGVLILVIFIIAAVMTPPDVISQMLMGIPMVALLEVSIGVCWLVERSKQRRLKSAKQPVGATVE